MSTVAISGQSGLENVLKGVSEVGAPDSGRASIGPKGIDSAQLKAEFQGALSQAARSNESLKSDNLKAFATGVESKADWSLKFSSHALDRMQSRGISFSQTEMERIENAIARAAQKGSKDTLVLAQDKAMIVSVKNKTVVTVMDRNAMRENVFTNIDSTVMV